MEDALEDGFGVRGGWMWSVCGSCICCCWWWCCSWSIFCIVWMYSTACRNVSTLDIFLAFAADGMWLQSILNPQLTCFTRFLSRAFLLATFGGTVGVMAYPNVGWNAMQRRQDAEDVWQWFVDLLLLTASNPVVVVAELFRPPKLFEVFGAIIFWCWLMLEVMLSDKTMIMSRNLSRVFNKKMIFEIFASQRWWWHSWQTRFKAVLKWRTLAGVYSIQASLNNWRHCCWRCCRFQFQDCVVLQLAPSRQASSAGDGKSSKIASVPDDDNDDDDDLFLLASVKWFLRADFFVSDCCWRLDKGNAVSQNGRPRVINGWTIWLNVYNCILQ